MFLTLKILNLKKPMQTGLKAVILIKLIHFFAIESVDALYINEVDQDILKNKYIQNIIIN